MDERIRRDIHTAGVPVVCQSCEARHKGVCGTLTPEQLTRLSDKTSKSVHTPDTDIGEAVSRDGEYANILSGVVKLTKLARDGRQQIVGLQFAPDFLGRPFQDASETEAVASTHVRLCSFPKEFLEELLEEQPAMERRIHEQTLAELDEAREWLFALGRKTAQEKLSSFLMLVATHANPESELADGMTIELPLKRADIADFLGLTIETVSRQITNLRKAGVINVVDRSHISIPSIARLRAACETEKT